MLTLSKKCIANFLIPFFITSIGMKDTYAECSQYLNAGIQKVIDEGRAKYGIPGIQVSISCPGEEQPRNFVSGTTTIEAETLVSTTNLLQIGSITKSFTAAILLRMEADGLLSINDPIGKWIPELPSDWKKITIKQLLNHTSGIVNYTETDEFKRIAIDNKFKKQWTPDELINLVEKEPRYFKPGQGFHYSNTNYVLAGMIISAASGKSVEEEMKMLLSASLPLSNTYYLPRLYNDDIMQRMAHGYYPSKVDSSLIDATDYNMSAANAAGAMISTSHDTAIWLRKLLTTASILPAQQRNEMMSLVDVENGQPIPITSEKTGYGLGVLRGFFSENEVWTHDGGTDGYRAEMLWLKCNDVVITTIININGEDSNIGFLVTDLVSYIQKSNTLNQCKTTVIPKMSTSRSYEFKTLN